MTGLMNLLQHFYFTELYALEVIFPHLVDIYAKNVDERGRNFMCERKLPRLLLLKCLQRHEIIWTTQNLSLYVISYTQTSFYRAAVPPASLFKN